MGGSVPKEAVSVSGVIEKDELSTALQLLSRGRATGVLVASASFANASVGFRDGEVLWASSTMGPRLGDVLVEKGLVTRDKLDAALWVQRQDKEWRALGHVVVDVKLVPRAAVEIAVEAQIVRVLDTIFRWDHGAFRFDPRPPVEGEIILPPSGDLGQLEIKVALLRQRAPGAPA